VDAKLTTKSQEALGDAIQQASAAGNPQLEPAHLLNALLAQEGGVANGLLDAVGADRGALGRAVRAALVALPAASGSAVAQPTASRATSTAIEAASSEARALGDDYVSTEHLLLGIAAGRSGVAGSSAWWPSSGTVASGRTSSCTVVRLVSSSLPPGSAVSTSAPTSASVATLSLSWVG